MRKVLEAQLHQAPFVRGIGHLGTTLSLESANGGAKTIQVKSMETDGVTLLVSLSCQGITAEALIPLTNVVILKLHPEEKKSVTKG